MSRAEDTRTVASPDLKLYVAPMQHGAVRIAVSVRRVDGSYHTVGKIHVAERHFRLLRTLIEAGAKLTGHVGAIWFTGPYLERQPCVSSSPSSR